MERARRILFVCSRNRRRSPTAETIAAGWPRVEALSAGTAPDADVRVSRDLIEWADHIVVMERRHHRRLAEAFGPLLRGTPVTVLGIPDDYEPMDPRLVRLLRQRLRALLGDADRPD